MANRVKALASTIFNFASKKALVPETFANPCANVEQPTKEESRERVLNDDEIKALWKHLDTRAEPTASIYRLVLLTGQRPGEVKAMRWSDIDGDNIWTIPRNRNQKQARTQGAPVISCSGSDRGSAPLDRRSRIRLCSTQWRTHPVATKR